MSASPKMILAELPRDAQDAWLRALAEDDPISFAEIERNEWWWTARPEQQPPEGNWFVWMMLTGRGFGKTRAGAEWLVDQALRFPRDRAGNPTNWLVVGETLADTRAFCIEGPSGILAVLRRRGVRYHYTKAPKPLITLLDEGGQIIYFEGVDNEDTGRGYNLAGAWLDELGKWRYTHSVWLEGIMPSLRADIPGGRPRCVVTTTPKPIKLLKSWVRRWRAGDHSFIRITTGSTYENAANLSPDQMLEFRKEYEGTTVGRQELHGELLEDVEGALWTHALIERFRHLVNRDGPLPEMVMKVVGLDPSGTGTGDEMGLVAVGRSILDEDYVLADWSRRMAGRPAARRAWELFAEVEADLLVYEDNLGKEWLTQVLYDAYREMQEEGTFPPGGDPPMEAVTAMKGKRLRARPVSMRYEQGRWHHVGEFPELEDQMSTWVPDEDTDSPDRVDALVHAGLFLRDREKYRAETAEPIGAMPTTGGYGFE